MSNNAYLRVDNSGTIYVLVKDRVEFNKITLPMTDHGRSEDGSHCLSKSIIEGPQWIVFQHWLSFEINLDIEKAAS